MLIFLVVKTKHVGECKCKILVFMYLCCSDLQGLLQGFIASKRLLRISRDTIVKWSGKDENKRGIFECEL